jgi:ribosomal-protein-alanine N-acetyltransferase
MLLIRNFREKDLTQVSNIIAAEFNRNYAPDFYYNLFERWNGGFLVAEDEKGIVGVLVAMLSQPKESRILLMAVIPEYRGRGIGKMMLAELVSRSLQMNLMAVTLEVRISNKSAIGFYNNHGFIIKTIISNYYENGEAGYLMRRVL